MTVSSTIPVNTFCGNNSATQFDFDFLIENEDELKVTYMNKYGELTELKNGIDYTINKTGSKDGSYITFPLETSEYKVLSEDEKIILELTLPIKQESKFENSGSMAWEAVEWSFDYIVRILQIMDRKIQKSVKIPEVNDYEETSEGLIRLLNETKTKSQHFSEYSEQKAKEAQQSALEAIENADYVKTYADDIKEALNIIKPADEDSLGMIKPDNKTTYIYNNGILSSPKYDMFDILTKDHKLTFEEKEGLELLGEYVYKEAQDGRYGYPDFYNKCIEEYQEEENTEEIIGYKNMTLNGSLTIENGLVSNFSAKNFIEVPAPSEEINSFRIECEFTLPQEISGIQGVYGQKTTNITSPQLQLNYNGNKSIGFNVPVPNDKGAGKWGDGVATDIPYILGATYKTIYEYKDGQVKASVKELSGEWQEYAVKDLAGVIWSEPLCFGKDQDTIIFGGKIDLSSIKIEVNNKFYAGTIKAKVNKNGHKYYNIEFKDKIDEIYNSTGLAWYYGVDEERERILLPRNDFYAPNLTEIPVTGTEKPIGFKGVDGNLKGLESDAILYKTVTVPNYNASMAYITGITDVFYNKQTAGQFSKIGLNPSPEKSGIIAKLNLAKKEQEYYIYMVVGNTTINQAQTKVTEVTTSENDTLPLFTGIYFDFKPNHVSWLKAGTEASGKTYVSAYNELVNILNKTEQKYGDSFKVVDVKQKLPNIDYSEYWIINQETQTFRTPLKTSLLNTISKSRILIEKKEPDADDSSWYNLYSDGWLEQGGSIYNNANSLVMVYLMKPYRDTNYFVTQTMGFNGTYNSTVSGQHLPATCVSQTRSSFSIWTFAADAGNTRKWMTKGYTMVPTTNQIAKSGNRGLYFKVGNALQNLELLDAGKVMENLNEKADKSIFITFQEPIVIFPYTNNPALGDYNLDLSNYIPNDGYFYEVCLEIYLNIADYSGIDRVVVLYDEFKTYQLATVRMDGGMFPSGNSSTAFGNISENIQIFLPSDSRKIVMSLKSTDSIASWGNSAVRLIWAKRL